MTQQNDVIPLINNTQVLKLQQLVREVARTGLPFGISTSAAGNTLLISLLLSELGPDAVAAGPLIAALQNFAIGICRASLLSNSLLIGPLNGKAQQALSQGNHDEAERTFIEIGKTLKQGWILATLLAGGSACILGFGGPILKAIGINHEIANEAQAYFKYYIIGAWPLLHSFADQQLAVGTKNPWLPALRGPIYGASVYAFSYLAVNGYFGEQFKNMSGIGLGSAAAAWLIFVLTKATHLLPSMRKYHLYNFDFHEGLKIFKHLVSVSSKLGFQVATEWVNLLGLSIIIGHMGKDNLHAMQPSIQLLTMSGLFSLGFSAGVGALCANAMGQLRNASEGNDRVFSSKNLSRLGHAGVIGGMVLPTALATMMVIIPRVFTASMLPDSISEDVLELSDTVLRINALGLFLDAFRINAAGPLRAFKDIHFVTFISFLLMSLIGLAVEGGSCLGGDQGLETFSWERDATILLPAILIFIRWMTYSKSEPEEQLALDSLHTQRGTNMSAMFKPVSVVREESGQARHVQNRV